MMQGPAGRTGCPGTARPAGRWLFRGAAVLLVGVLLGCGSPSGAPRRGPGPAAPDAPPASDAAALPGSGIFRRIDLLPDAEIDQIGVFFLDLVTGAREGWAVADEPDLDYSVSDDNRWVSAQGEPFFYLLDRQTGKAVRWRKEERRLLGALGDHLALATWDGVLIAGPELEPVVTVVPVAAPGPQPPAAAAVFDGAGAAALVAAGDGVYRVDLQTGAVRRVDTLPRPAEYLWLERTADGGQVQLTYRLRDGAAPGEPLAYTWRGERAGTPPLPRWWERSPDGTLVAWAEEVSDIVPAITVADARTGDPLWRVDGAHWNFGDPRAHGRYHWLADSSGLVAVTGEGYRIITRAGELLTLPGLADSAGSIFPVPGRPDLFLRSRQEVINRQGEVLGALRTAPSLPPGHLSPWGQTADVLRVTTHHLGHGGYLIVPPDFPVRVLRPPFPEQVELVIGLPPADCLNLRAEPEGARVTCLPGGTVVRVAQPPPRDNKGELVPVRPYQWDGRRYTWIHVQAPGGETGWIAYEEGNLTWAPAP